MAKSDVARAKTEEVKAIVDEIEDTEMELNNAFGASQNTTQLETKLSQLDKNLLEVISARVQARKQAIEESRASSQSGSGSGSQQSSHGSQRRA